MATHSSISVWEIPWTEEPGRLQSMGVTRVRHSWAHTHCSIHYISFSFGKLLFQSFFLMVNINRHNLHKQELVVSSIIFKSVKLSWHQQVTDHFLTIWVWSVRAWQEAAKVFSYPSPQKLSQESWEQFLNSALFSTVVFVSPFWDFHNKGRN